MTATLKYKGRQPVAARNAPRVQQTDRYQLHLLRRAKLLTPKGDRIHYGVGTYDSWEDRYISVFHSTPENHEHSDDFFTFQGGCSVERVLADPVDGFWNRLTACASNPQQWATDHNCQHTAYWIFFGIEESPTVTAATQVGGFALLAVGVLTLLAAE